MKSIEETHPSIMPELHKWEISADVFPTSEWSKIIQKHTIDKAVLREIMTRKRQTPFKGTEASDDLHSQVIEDIWKLLEEEE